MALRPSALIRRDPSRVIGKEIAMIGLGVGVVVAVRSRHEGDVFAEKIAGIIASPGVHAPQENPDTQ